MNEYERSLDEAIAHEREVAKRNRILLDSDELVQKSYDAYFDKLKCKKCAEEHEQLAEWLEELKDYRDKNKMVVRIDCENMDSIKDKIEELSRYAEIQYNKAIDDFAEKIKSNDRLGYVGCLDKIIDEMAEQLKEGGEQTDDN